MTRLTNLLLLAGLLLLSGFSIDVFPDAAKTMIPGSGAEIIFADTTCSTSLPVISCRNWSNSMGHLDTSLCVMMNLDNILRIKSRIRTASDNLDPYARLMLEYDWDGHLSGVTPPIEPDDLQPITVNGIELYEVVFEFEIVLNDACGINPPNVPFPFSYVNKLVTYDQENGTYPLYPVSSTPELFPPDVFEELILWGAGYIPVYTGDKDLCCTNQSSASAMTVPGGNTTAEIQETKGAGSEGANIDVNLSGKLPVSSASSYMETARVYPNPFSGDFDILFQLPEAGAVYFELVDISGKQVEAFDRIFSKGQNQVKIEGQNYMPGIYFCKIRYRDQFQTYKLVRVN